MKAIIMAGGEGKRLRPITETMPKPLVPVNNVPVIRRTLRLIKRFGIDDAVITTGYLAEEIEKSLGCRCDGVNITYCRESEPLGTAGGVKAAENLLDGDDFIVISGDAVYDFDLSAAIAKKKESGADALIVLTHVNHPGEYGVVICDGEGRVTGFSEKPSISGTYSDTVNTGIYLLSKNVLDLIPNGTPYDFGHDLFPQMLSSGMKIYSRTDSGYWCDIGDPEKYHSANMKLSSDNNVIGQNCLIESDDIKSAVIMENCRIEKNCRITESIICKNVTVENDCVIGAGCIIGENSVVSEGSVLTDGTRLSSDSHVPPGMILRSVSVCGGIISAETLLSDKGIRCRTESLSASLAVKIGGAMTEACGKGRIGIMHDGTTYSCRAATAILRGIRSFGGEAVLLGSGFDAAASYAASEMKLDLAVSISTSGKKFDIAVFDENGLYPKRDTERKFLSALSDDTPSFNSRSLRTSECDFVENYYFPMLSDQKISLDGLAVNIVRENTPSKLLTRLLLSRGAVIRPNGIRLSVSDDGFSVLAEQDGFVLDDWHIKALILKYLIRDDAALPISSPAILFDIGGSRIRSFSHCPSGTGEDNARSLVPAHPELRHGCAAGAAIVGLASSSGRTLRELASYIPKFAVDTAEMTFPETAHHLGVLASLGTPAGDGVIAEYARGSVRIVPNRTGFKISSEAASGEYASELISLSKKEIQQLLKKNGG